LTNAGPAPQGPRRLPGLRRPHGPRDPAGSAGADGLRLCLGTLTIFPVRPPRVVERRTAATAMMLAPLAGLLLAVATGALLWLLGYGPTGADSGLWAGLSRGVFSLHPASPLIAAALTIALLAALTRCLHLDGLADTADGLGSAKPREQALEVMRHSDIGPFGVVTLVLVLLVQVVALAELLATGRGVAVLAVALVVSRLSLPIACRRGIPAARPDGLGALVAGSVGPGRLLAAGLGVLTGLAGLATAMIVAPGFLDGSAAATLVAAGIAAALSLGVGVLFLRWCVRRLGGVTGDVLGACVEVTFTAVLLLLALL
jgi:adenosylcobinamide-GDP ribazoletransferase